MLKSVPEKERRAVLRAAIMYPAAIVPVFCFGLLFFPPYVEFMLNFFGALDELDMFVFLAKMGGIILLPVCIFVPLLKKTIMPYCICKIMQKRGFLSAEGNPLK